MTDLINAADRYHLIGVRTIERDDNSTLDPGNAPASQRVDGEVVYTTNDKDEANAIARAGGFQRDGGSWIAVQGWRDTHKYMSGSGADAPSPLKMDS